MDNNKDAGKGYFLTYRKIFDNPIFIDDHMYKLYSYCLGMANYTDQNAYFDGCIIPLQRGQFLAGRFTLSKALHWTESATYDRLNRLAKWGYIDIQTSNKCSLITVLKYDMYQKKDAGKKTEKGNNKTQPETGIDTGLEKEVNEKGNNKVTTTQQQSNTANKVNKDNTYNKKDLSAVKADKAKQWAEYNRKKQAIRANELEQTVKRLIKQKNININRDIHNAAERQYSPEYYKRIEDAYNK